MLLNSKGILCFTFLLILPALASAELTESSRPMGLWLTWQQDPTTTMTIDWYTLEDGETASLEYRLTGSDEWLNRESSIKPFPYSDRLIHRVELTGLEPDSEYQFRFEEGEKIRKFRTMPVKADRPIRFVTGGDIMRSTEWMEQTSRRAAAYEPDFIIWGGDLAYADGIREHADRWYVFLEIMENTLVTADGRVIPVLTGLGNHEFKAGFYHRDGHDRREGYPVYKQNDETRELLAPYFFNLAAFPGQPGYGVLDFGEYMSIIILDTDHANPIEGEQTEWLEETLDNRRNIAHVFPVYHVPAYPSVRDPNGDPDGGMATRIREHWHPHFEEAGIKVAFENHNHAYKRTYPIRDEQIHPDGVVYIGDGAWGVSTREIGLDHKEHAWYLDRAASQRHFILGTIHGNLQHFLMINESGEIIDEYPVTPHIDLNERNLIQPWLPAPVAEDPD